MRVFTGGGEFPDLGSSVFVLVGRFPELSGTLPFRPSLYFSSFSSMKGTYKEIPEKVRDTIGHFPP